MNKLRILTVLMVPLLLSNCDEGDLPGPLDLLAGTWISSSIVTTGCTDSSQNGTLDCDPFCFSITIDADGSYSITDGLDSPPSTESGVITATLDKITLCATGDECSTSTPAGYSLNGSSLVVSFTDEELPGCEIKASFSKQ